MKQEAFLIPINAITETQISAIDNFINQNSNILILAWTFTVTEKCVYGYTFYEDYGAMNKFIMSLDLNKKYIYWYDFLPDGLELDEINRKIIIDQRKEKLNKIHDKTRN